MITTSTLKEHLNDVFEMGPRDAPRERTALLLGSCRCVPYLNYLENQPLHVYAIEPNNYHSNQQEISVNIEEVLAGLETNERILSIISSVGIFMHEHYANFQMFNTSRDEPKNIYQFGMTAEVDIGIPNWHNHFILEADYLDCGVRAPDDYIEKGEAEIEKFCGVCELSSFPEFAQTFRDTWRVIRYFWRPNHVSAMFTKAIFRLMIDKHMRYLDIGHLSDEDMFSYPCSEPSQKDREEYRLKW